MACGVFMFYKGGKVLRIIISVFIGFIKKKALILEVSALDVVKVQHIVWNAVQSTLYITVGVWILLQINCLMGENLGP